MMQLIPKLDFMVTMKMVPIPLKALAREYGTSRGEKKKPFMRKAFKDTTQ
jgi:hypothetical protein